MHRWQLRGLSGCVLAATVLLAAAGRVESQAKAATQTQGELRRVQGVVFDDANGNGVRDTGEKGISGIAVSDQFSVATTNAAGEYQIAVAGEASFVFVSQPDGWAASGLFWRRLTTAMDQPFDFALRQRPAATEFTFLHASDTHLTASSLPRMRKLREMVERTKPAFVLITGDLIRDALRVSEAEARGSYELLVAELKQFSVPVFTVPGNHEVFGIERHQSLVSASHPLYGRKMYRHYLGPDYYSFTWGGVRFVGLNSVDIADLWYYGHMDAKQLEWLGQDLATAAPGAAVVTFNHIPFASSLDALYGFGDEPPGHTVIRIAGRTQYRHTVSNTGEVLARMKDRRWEIALGGHFHTSESIAINTNAMRVRFHQTGAVVGPNTTQGMTMTSGVTLYRVRGGKVDDGTFLPLDQPQ